MFLCKCNSFANCDCKNIFETVLLHANGRQITYLVGVYAIWMICVRIEIMNHRVFSHSTHCVVIKNWQKEKIGIWLCLWFAFHPSRNYRPCICELWMGVLSFAHAQTPHSSRLPLFAFAKQASLIQLINAVSWTWYDKEQPERAMAVTTKWNFAPVMDELELD